MIATYKINLANMVSIGKETETYLAITILMMCTVSFAGNTFAVGTCKPNLISYSTISAAVGLKVNLSCVLTMVSSLG